MATRAELQALLDQAEADLEALPRAHEVKHPHSVMARRTALEVKITSLRERVSTAPVHNGLPPVEPTGLTGDDGPCLDDQGARLIHNSPQDDSQGSTAADLQ